MATVGIRRATPPRPLSHRAHGVVLPGGGAALVGPPWRLSVIWDRLRAHPFTSDVAQGIEPAFCLPTSVCFRRIVTWHRNRVSSVGLRRPRLARTAGKRKECNQKNKPCGIHSGGPPDMAHRRRRPWYGLRRLLRGWMVSAPCGGVNRSVNALVFTGKFRYGIREFPDVIVSDHAGSQSEPHMLGVRARAHC